uniref:Dolichyl-phosphate beta-glucosyltransferase n=1 Tax=Daphnia barbata TaxID=414587 RepID=A0A4Y7M3Z4_9CRUS|nr:EOG090X0BIY [Daphnia barbata]
MVFLSESPIALYWCNVANKINLFNNPNDRTNRRLSYDQLLFMLLFIYLTSETYAKIIRYREEQFYLDPNTREKKQFPSIEDPSTLLLSVIVPAYNEEKRLPVMLEECLDFLEKKLKGNPSCTYEVIIVDDGSTDRTTEVGLSYSKKYGCHKVRVLTLSTNRGKGGAVRLGILSSRGKQLLFADADGATTFEDISKLQDNLKQLINGQSLDDALALVCGSRAHLEKEAIASRSFFRTILMKGFHLLVWLFAARSVRDTQCGFKLFTRSTARLCFPNLHIERWAFDVELLYIAEYMKIPTGEVAVRWEEIEGDILVHFFSYLHILRRVFLLPLQFSNRYIALGYSEIRISKGETQRRNGLFVETWQRHPLSAVDLVWTEGTS